MYKNLKKYVTNTSKTKLQHIDKINNVQANMNPKLQKMLDDIKIAFGSDLKIDHQPINKLIHTKNIFIEFSKDILNVPESKFEHDLSRMNNYIGINLHVHNSIIKLNFIFNGDGLIDYTKYISAIVHALNTFCHMFKYNYHNLEINVCLDNNERIIPDFSKEKSIKDKIIYLQKNSLAFNSSGVTYRQNLLINLTRTEEIVKLLFHEMIHWIRLDNALVSTPFKNKWATTGSGGFYLYEAYTEFMSILLYSAYQSIHIYTLIRTNPYDIFQMILSLEFTYSIYLTSRILRFFEYDANNYEMFFNGTGHKKTQPIFLWEYIFFRTILMLDIEAVMEILPQDYRLDATSTKLLSSVFNDDHKLINELSSVISEKNISDSVSYLLVDLDWSLI